MQKWNSIENQNDIENLLKEYVNFHDSCITSLYYESGAGVDDNGSMHGISRDCSLLVSFESQTAYTLKKPEKKKLNLKFTGLRMLNLVGYEEDYFCSIFDCHLSISDKGVVWANVDSFSLNDYRETDLLNDFLPTFIIADKLYWSFG